MTILKRISWGNLGLVLAGTVAGVLILEMGLRLVSGEPLIPNENLIVRKVALLRIHTLNQYDPLLGWVLKENMPTNGQVTTGQFGVRMNSTTQKPVPMGGILASGDSFTAGSEVEDHESWPAQLEQILSQSVVNAATGAWGSDQIILRVEQLLPLVRPKTVVVSYLVDDIERNVYRIHAGGNKPYFEIANGNLVHRNNPVPVFSGHRDELGLVRSVLGYSKVVNWTMERIGYTNWWRDGAVYERAQTDPVMVSVLLMKRLKAELDKQGIRLIFLLQYGGGQIVTWKVQPDYAISVLDNYEKMGIECMNTWRLLKDIYEHKGEAALKPLFVMHDGGKVYGHMSKTGNRFIADLLASKIGPSN